MDQAIKIALQQRSTAPRGAIPRPGLTHQDVFFTNVSVADDFFPALAVHQETTLPSMTLPNERVQLVVAVASIMEAALQEAVRHRLASGSQYQSCVAATQPDPEYLPWTGGQGHPTVFLRGGRHVMAQHRLLCDCWNYANTGCCTAVPPWHTVSTAKMSYFVDSMARVSARFVRQGIATSSNFVSKGIQQEEDSNRSIFSKTHSKRSISTQKYTFVKTGSFKAGQTYLSGHGGMRVQPNGIYIERIPQSHKRPCISILAHICSLEYCWIERFAIITAY